MDELVKTLIGIVVIFFMVVAPLLKKVLERGKAPAPKPRGPAGGGEGAPIRNLRDFLKQLEDLAQERRPAPPEPSPQQRAPAPIPVPPRRPPQAAQKAARRAQIAARARAEAEARAREAAVKARLFAAAAPAAWVRWVGRSGGRFRAAWMAHPPGYGDIPIHTPLELRQRAAGKRAGEICGRRCHHHLGKW